MKLQGTSGLGEQMDRMMKLTRYQVEKMKQEKERFYLLDDDPECVNVCFWYIPERLRKSEHTKQKEIELGVVSRFRISTHIKNGRFKNIRHCEIVDIRE